MGVKAHDRSLGYLVPQFPGQTHIFIWREIMELERLGISVDLFSTRPPPPRLVIHNWSDEASARTTYVGKPDILAGLSALPRLAYRELLEEVQIDGSRLLKDIAISVPAAQRLVRYCRMRGISHVHAHSCGRAALITAIAFSIGGPEYSLSLHGPLADYGPGQRFKWRHAKFASVITQKLRDEIDVSLRNALPSRIFVQPMGVNTDFLAPEGPYQPAEVNGVLKLFSCARLNAAKGHEDLLKATRHLLDMGRKIQLRIAGEDDDGGSGYRRVLEKLIRDLGLQDNVRLLGAVDAGQVRQEILTAHIFVLASWSEPLGVALMEAMSCGTPTIGTAAGGVKELIRDGQDGLLVPPKAPEALAVAIERVAHDADLARRLSISGRARILEKFHSKRGAEMLIKGVWGE